MDTAVEEGSEEAGVGREQETGFARKHLGKVSLVAQEPGSLSGAGRGGGRCHPGWLVESLEDIAKDLSLRFGLCTLGFGPASPPSWRGMAIPPRDDDSVLESNPCFPGNGGSPGQGQGGTVASALLKGRDTRTRGILWEWAFMATSPRPPETLSCISTLQECTLPGSEKPEGFWGIHPSCW